MEFEAVDQEDQEAPQQGALEGEEQAQEELPECPDHKPTSFSKRQALEHSKPPMFYKYHLSPLCLMH